MTLLGILLPALLVVLAVRRWYAPVPWTAAAVMLALTLAFLHGAVFTGKVPVPVDEVMRGYPYRGMAGDVTPRNPLTNDTVKQILPWMHAVREQLRHGHLPLWNPHQFSGYPLLANGQSAPFAPLFLATLFVALPKQLVAMAGLKLFLALLFGWLFLRDEGVSPAAALFGSVIFAFSVFQTVYLYYPLTTVTCLLPAAAYAARNVGRASARHTILLALVTAAVAASGHPESAVHIAIAVLILLALERKNPTRAIVAAIFGLALAAPAWIPVVEQALLSVRATLHAPLTLVPTAAWAALNPDGFGNPARGTWNWIYNYSVVAPTYIGLLPLALVIAAPFSRRTTRRDLLLVAIIALLFVVAMNWTALGTALNRVPPLSLMANDRLRFVICFFAAIVAARAIERLSIATAVVSAGVFAAAAWVLHAKWGIASAAGVIALALFWILTPLRRFRAHAAALAILFELFAINSGFNALVSASYYRPSLPILDALQTLSRGEPSRVIGHDWTFLPNAAVQYGVEDVRGSDPMALASYARFFKRAAADDPSSDVLRVQNVDHPDLGFLGVRFLMTDPSFNASPLWTLRYEGPDGKLFERTRWQRRFFGNAHVGAIVQESPTKLRVTIEAGKPTFIASSQVYAPGWRVTVDGKRTPIRLLHGTFIGFDVPRGKHSVVIRYVPMAFYGSLLWPALALLLWPLIRPSGTFSPRGGEKG